MGVKVVADSHALVYYLVDPERLKYSSHTL